MRLQTVQFLVIAMSIALGGACRRKIPFVATGDPVTPLATVHVTVENTSQGEHDFIVAKSSRNVRYEKGSASRANCPAVIRLADHRRSGSTSTLSFATDFPGCGSALVRTHLSNLKVVYAGGGKQVRLVSPELAFKQYEFRRTFGSRAESKYALEVQFDPNSEVEIGGMVARTNELGRFIFGGVKLDVSSGGQGVLVLVDAAEKRVRAEQGDDGRWYVLVIGQSLGKSVEQRIEVEALR